jgi:ferredoxin
MKMEFNNQEYYFLPHVKINALLDYLHHQGFSCIGPQIKQDAIVYEELHDSEQLPWGLRDYQMPGQYRLEENNVKRAFSWANGPQAIKPQLFKPKESLWRVARDSHGKLTFKNVTHEMKPIALFGVRSCDVAGMLIQDKAFLTEPFVDKHYQARRENVFVIAVNCGYSSNNCFCVSTNTGPQVKAGYDIALTEIDDGFVVTVGSAAGEALINKISLKHATDEMQQAMQREINNAATMQSKAMPFDNTRVVRDLLMNNLDHPQWDDVAARCLSCGNCTSVCPTCFCSSETETPALDRIESEHSREWDSCFTEGHSYIHGKVIRDDTKSRYKQWLTHKLATWWDQFDTSGCVGCGRCVTWCPVGIDITAEVAAIAKPAVDDSASE